MFGQRALHTVFALDGRDIRNLLHVQERSNTGQKTFSKGAMSSNNVRDALLLNILNQQRRKVLRETLHHIQPD